MFGTGTCIVTMNSNLTITATFDKVTVPIANAVDNTSSSGQPVEMSAGMDRLQTHIMVEVPPERRNKPWSNKLAADYRERAYTVKLLLEGVIRTQK